MALMLRILGGSWFYLYGFLSCIIVDKKMKILNPFNLESITVHLVMLFDVFF